MKLGMWPARVRLQPHGDHRLQRPAEHRGVDVGVVAADRARVRAARAPGRGRSTAAIPTSAASALFGMPGVGRERAAGCAGRRSSSARGRTSFGAARCRPERSELRAGTGALYRIIVSQLALSIGLFHNHGCPIVPSVEAVSMKVGIPREVKNHEYRVAITPSGVHELVRNGHEVYLERDAGVGSAIPNADYVAAGAADPATPPTTCGATGDLVLKVKEPVAEEYHRMRKDQVLFTYLHLAADKAVHRRPARGRHDRHRLRDRAAARRLAAAARADVRGRRTARPAGRLVPPDAPGRRPRHADGRRARASTRPRSSSSAPACPGRTRPRSRSACRPRCCCSTATSPGCARWTRSTRATARRSRRTPTRSSARCSTPTW